MSNIIYLNSDSESQPLFVSPQPSKVGKFLDNSPLYSLMNVKGGDDEGEKTKRRSLKSKLTESGNDLSSVKRKRRRFIHEFFSESDTNEKILTQNKHTDTLEDQIILSHETNSIEIISTISNGCEVEPTLNSPVAVDNSNDSSVLIIENGVTDDVILIADSQSPNSSLVSHNTNVSLEEIVSTQDENTEPQSCIVKNVNSSSEKLQVQVCPSSPERICNFPDVSTNISSPSKFSSPPNVARDLKRKSDLTAESSNTSPSSVSHSRSFRIVNLACNEDDVSWQFSREQNNRSLATNLTGSGHINGNVTPPSALMNGRAMKMLMVRSDSPNLNKVKSFKVHNSASTEKKTKQLRQYTIKECTSPGILKNSTANAAPSPKTSKMVNFAENLTQTKFYRVGDALYHNFISDEENDDEVATAISPFNILYPPLRNCKDAIDSLVEELNMDAVTVELFHRMDIKSVGDLASIQMVEMNDIPATHWHLDRLRKTLKKYNKERRPTGLRTPSYYRTSTLCKTIVELLEQIRQAQNADQLFETDTTKEDIRMDDSNICGEKLNFEKSPNNRTWMEDQKATSSAQPTLDESSRFANNIDMVTSCKMAESTNPPEKHAITDEEITTDIVDQQQPLVGIENEDDSDFVCTNDGNSLNSSSLVKLSEVSRSIPSLPSSELIDQGNVAPCSPEIISSLEIITEHQRDDEMDNQSQILDLEDSNDDDGRDEANAGQQIKLIFWKQAAALTAKQFAIEQSTKDGEMAMDSEVDTLVDDFIKMTADVLKVFVSSDCLNVFDRRRLGDVCHQVADLFTEVELR